MPQFPDRARVTRAPLRAALALGLLTLGACGGADDAPTVEVGVLEPSEQAQRARPGALIAPQTFRSVARIERLEIGAVYGGVMLTAYGTAPAAGWYAPRLTPRRNGLPGPDGFVEFDLEAAPPELNGGALVDAAARSGGVRGDLDLQRNALAGAVGLRVHGADNAMAIALPPEG